MAQTQGSSGSSAALGISDDVRANPPREFETMLAMFRACVTEQGLSPAIIYFDNMITYAEMDQRAMQ